MNFFSQRESKCAHMLLAWCTFFSGLSVVLVFGNVTPTGKLNRYVVLYRSFKINIPYL